MCFRMAYPLNPLSRNSVSNFKLGTEFILFYGKNFLGDVLTRPHYLRSHEINPRLIVSLAIVFPTKISPINN